MAALGDLNAYTQFKTAEAIGTAAANEGAGGGAAATGVGFGAGIGMGQAMADAMREARSAPQGGAAAPATMNCPRCHAQVPVGSKFCPNCGQTLQAEPVICPKCGTQNPAGSKFCTNCGTALT